MSHTHSVLPWHLDDKERLEIYAANGRSIGTFGVIANSENQHNVVYMLRAVNSHQALIDALATIANWEHIPELPAASFEAVKLCAREALAKVSQ